LNGAQSPRAPNGDFTVWSSTHVAPAMHWPLFASQRKFCAQSASALHDSLHDFSPHANGAHKRVFGVPGAPHWPVPSHVAENVSTPLSHAWSRQGTSLPTKPTHVAVLLEPSHTRALHAFPSVAPAHAGRVPCGLPEIGEQVPVAVGTSHASHCPVHAVLQHTPSTQKPLAHESFVVHGVPVGLACLHRSCEREAPWRRRNRGS
jgi:hypothetical protein